MKRLMLTLIMSVTFAHGLELTHENVQEIQTRWRKIFDEQLQQTQKKQKQSYETYKQEILKITDQDAQTAGELIARVCQGELWQTFVEKRDRESMMAYLTVLTQALQKYIDEKCTMLFPPELQDIDEDVKRSSLTTEEFCDRTRSALLTFTIIVSKMHWLMQQ